jgi:hypothetical protein
VASDGNEADYLIRRLKRGAARILVDIASGRVTVPTDRGGSRAAVIGRHRPVPLGFPSLIAFVR